MMGAAAIENDCKDFWFIYNELASYVVMRSDTSKRYITMQGMPGPDGVLYYHDLFERMRNIIWNRKA